jgi:hypothetical protein
MNEKQDQTVEDVMEECIEKLQVDPTEAVQKPVMVSLKTQLINERGRHLTKIMQRRIKAGVKQPVGMIITGNKDHGCPYTGKDKFSGQNRKFADRIDTSERGEGNTSRLWYADNNKFNGNGTLKD